MASFWAKARLLPPPPAGAPDAPGATPSLAPPEEEDMAADVSENPEDEAVEGGVEDGRGDGRDREAVFWLMHSDQVGTEKIRP